MANSEISTIDFSAMGFDDALHIYLKNILFLRPGSDNFEAM
jgi:hypothetical protein